jgi:hypothetical protein
MTTNKRVLVTIVRTDLWSQRAILEKDIIVRRGFKESLVKS